MVFAVVAAVLIAGFLIPLKKSGSAGRKRTIRADERDISFSRNRLKKGSLEYSEYYGRNPHLEETDRRIRELPGLMSPKSKYFNRLNSAAASASFSLIDHLRNTVDGEKTGMREDLHHEEVLNYLQSWLDHAGADCVAAGRISSGCWYSHVGRGTGTYGEEILPEHDNALVIGFRMDPHLTGSAPKSSEVVETALRYSDCAVAAVQAAEFLRSLGYSARAHIDGNYRVSAAGAAKDAGLGNFGWSGLLLTEEHGPSVRFSVVTTDLPVPEMKLGLPDYLPFCKLCMKCVRNCPSRSISPDEPGAMDSDRCFAFWNTIGTDCGVCMAVCPMGHRWGILRKLALNSALAARLLIFFDDLFYGRKHKPGEGAEKWKD